MNEIGFDGPLDRLDGVGGLRGLHDLADRVSAPPSDAARQAIGRRAGALRRRQRARRAAGGGLLALAVVAGAFAWRGDDRSPNVEAGDPASSGEEGRAPDLTRYLPGWGPVTVQDDPAAPWDSSGLGITPGEPGSLQVFRRPGQLAGPTVVLEHWPASDAVVGETGTTEVDVGGATAYLMEMGPTWFTLDWQPPNGDGHASLRSFGLTRDEVLAFADGLQAKGEAISYPPQPGDVFGFDATVFPQGVEEDPVGPAREVADTRHVRMQREVSSIDIWTDTRGEIVFEAILAERRANAEVAESVSVAGRPAVLLQESEWTLLWYEDGVMVEVFMDGLDRTEVEEVVEALDGMPDDELRALVTPAG